ncbi:MAG: DUF2933 domain-containing protein [Rubrobacter sp.]|jgi:hypothetical protein|nr:DUF2933 domain-containing protein [Rubrobacter sp.]
MKMLKMCLNWRVLLGLGALGVGTYAVAPDLALAVLPFLVLAICPLSMMFMMKGMQGNGGEDEGEQASQEAGASLNREEQLARLQAQQEALSDQISELEGTDSQTVVNREER